MQADPCSISPAAISDTFSLPPSLSLSPLCITTCPWGLQHLNSVAALTKKGCCRGKGRIQKTVKMGFGKSGGASGRSDFQQRDCVTVSCALVKHGAVQGSWLSTWLRKGKPATMALWLPGFCPPELVLSLTSWKD